jgi:hypothetical protein
MEEPTLSHDHDPRLVRFKFFCAALWHTLNLPEPTDAQYDIAEFLEKGPKRRMVQAFRGVGKSWLTAAYVLWRLYLNPNERILVVSASKDRADSFSVFVKRLIEQTDFLMHLKPDPLKGQRDSVVAFDVGPSDPHQAPSVRSVGITGQMTGGRATIIVADDIETPKNSMTLLMRDRLGELVKEFDAVLTPGGEIIYLGTPQCEESVYNKLPERGYTVRIWPARYPDRVWLAAYGDKLSDRFKGLCLKGGTGSTDPKRFNSKDLDEREASYGRSGFALQFMLDTRLSDALKYPLKLADFIVVESDLQRAPLSISWGSGENQRTEIPCVGMKGDRWNAPLNMHKDFDDYTGAVMFIDPSGRGKDETAYAVVKILNSTLYLVASGGYTEGYTDEVLVALAKVAKRHSVNVVQVEPNFGDGMFLRLFQPHLLAHHKCLLEESERATSQKEKRIIETLEPVLNQHRLVVSSDVIRTDLLSDPHMQLFYQLSRITGDKDSLRHDDRLDALAGAVGYWTSQLARSQESALSANINKLQQKELKRFMETALGRPPKRSRVSSEYVM